MLAHGFYSERGSDPNVVRARARIHTTTSFRETCAPQLQGPSRGTVNLLPEEDRSRSRISAADLYREAEPTSPVLYRGLMLLEQAIACAIGSIDAAAQGDPLDSDLHVQSLRPLLRKLFMCRAVGDGFGAIVDALIIALENNHGQPLETSRLHVLRNALVKLREEPFLSFTQAMTTIEDIERVGFSTEPPGFEQLADWLTI